MYIGQKVKIAEMPDYNSVPELAVGKCGKIVDTWTHPWRQEFHYLVKMDENGKTYPFTKEEIETYK